MKWNELKWKENILLNFEYTESLNLKLISKQKGNRRIMNLYKIVDCESFGTVTTTVPTDSASSKISSYVIDLKI